MKLQLILQASHSMSKFIKFSLCHTIFKKNVRIPRTNFSHQTIAHALTSSSGNSAKNSKPISEARAGVFHVDAGKYCIIRLRCLTDFAANSDSFGSFAVGLTQIIGEAKESHLQEGLMLKELEKLSCSLQEPVMIDTLNILENTNPQSIFGHYIHRKGKNGLGTRASIVEGFSRRALDNQSRIEAEQNMNKLAAHIIALNPTDVNSLFEQIYFLGDGLETVREFLDKKELSVSSYFAL